jgi:hypothetical protein
MHLELVPLLRCPVAHADGWLVAAVDRATDRFIVDGTLGCPTCGAEFTIHGGVTDMSPPVPPRASLASPDVSQSYRMDAMRLAALLGADSSHTVALLGHDVGDTEALQALVPLRCLVINPPVARAPQYGTAPVGVMVSASVIPLAKAQFQAVSLAPAAAALIGDAMELLRPGGRLVAPVTIGVPGSLTMLASDDAHWVAERVAGSGRPIAISRRIPG